MPFQAKTNVPLAERVGAEPPTQAHALYNVGFFAFKLVFDACDFLELFLGNHAFLNGNAHHCFSP